MFLRAIFTVHVLIILQIANAQNHIYVQVMGIAQDGGIPQVDCKKQCCELRHGKPAVHQVASLAVVDQNNHSFYLIDATPDLPTQWQTIKYSAGKELQCKGIFLTHAHIGHYTGLMYMGREVMSTSTLPVYVMPRMQEFLTSNGPWNQLVDLKNINLIPIKKDNVKITSAISIRAIPVPHRDEYSETVGYVVESDKKLIYIPDIDKWEKWEHSLEEMINEMDYILIDGTFFDINELPGRNMDNIPHPPIKSTIEKLANLEAKEKQKIHFIHFNHTNPVLNKNSEEYKYVIDQGFQLTFEGMTFEL